METLVTITAPADLPVTVADARNQCRLYDDDTHDELLLRLIKSATDEFEKRLHVRFITQTLELKLDTFPRWDLPLPVYPVQSITSVKYDDVDDAEQTVASADYHEALSGMEPYLKVVSYWPSTYSGKPEAVRVRFVAGYTDHESVPEDLKQALLVRVFELWEGSDMNHGAKMAMQHRRFR